MQRLASRAFLIFALLMLAACARDDLTQQQAAAILSKTPLRAEQQTIQLRAEVGQFADPKAAADWAKRYILATDQAAASAIEQQAPSPVGAARETIVGNLARLREAGRQGLLSDVSFSENKRGEAVELVATGIIAKDLASSCRRQDGATYQPGDPVCVAVVAVRRFGAVTAIKGDTRKKAAEISLSVEPTAIGRRLGFAKKSETRSASFVRDEKGWRFTGL